MINYEINMKKFKSKNVLVIGSTGSGRSNFIDKLIVSFLNENNPEDLKLILIDPKKVNFAQYNGVAHLLSEVIDGTAKANSALKWAWGESMRRLKMLEGMDINSIYEYKGNKNFQNKFPEIIIVIEELTPFVVSENKFFESYIKRITALSELTGIYMVIATSRSIPEVITNGIKSSFWNRIVFRLPSENESIIAIGESGAEKINKPGLCLAKDFISLNTEKIQMPFISEEEIAEAIKIVKEKYTDFQILMNAKDAVEQKEEDILYEEAKKIVLKTGKASASLLQRTLKVGYSRAARLIDMLEENGVVGEANGAEPRKVLIQK